MEYLNLYEVQVYCNFGLPLESSEYAVVSLDAIFDLPPRLVAPDNSRSHGVVELLE